MVEFKLEGLDKPLVLPDEYLTVKKWEECLRFFTKANIKELDFEDLSTLREMTGLLLAEPIDLGDIPMTPNNLNTLLKVYNHVGTLLSGAMSYGDEVIDDQVKKEPKGRGRPKKTKPQILKNN